MVEIKPQELITLQGRLKMNIITKISDKSGEEYYFAPMEIDETEKNEQKIGNQFGGSIMLIFWKKDFDSKSQSVINNLKKDQPITVHGKLSGQDNGLLRVVDYETEDSEDVFI